MIVFNINIILLIIVGLAVLGGLIAVMIDIDKNGQTLNDMKRQNRLQSCQEQLNEANKKLSEATSIITAVLEDCAFMDNGDLDTRCDKFLKTINEINYESK